MKQDCPLTKEEAFAKLDELLSEEDKKCIMQAEDVVDFHFSLGMWIRNSWIYENDPERVDALLKDLGEEFIHPDSISEAILEGYQKHLKRLSDNE